MNIASRNTINYTVDYLDGYQYESGKLLFFPTSEGYVKYTENVRNPFDYVYNYTDHLGNIRLSYGINPETGLLTKIEENNYYPFGLKHRSYNTEARIIVKHQPVNGLEIGSFGKYMVQKTDVLAEEMERPPNSTNSNPEFYSGYKYKFSRKELQDELGLNTYDFGFRQYMPDIGRMPNLDPLAELAYDITPNRYCFNNPLRFIDPSGLWEETANGYTTNKAEDIKRFMSYLDVENLALNNSPSSEQTSSFIQGEMSPGGHGKTSNGAVLADEITIGGSKSANEKSISNFWHGVQRSLTPNALDPRTVGQQFGGIGGLTYSGLSNPKTYAGNDDYSYKPQRIEDYPGLIHDLAYDKMNIKGAGGLFTATNAISTDYKFVTQELAISIYSTNIRTKITAGALGVGLGACALPKTVYSFITDTYTKIIEATKN